MSIQGTTTIDVRLIYASDSKLSEAYVNGTRLLPAHAVSPKPLTPQQWECLNKVERRLYDADSGTHAYTDVMTNDGDVLLRAMWNHCHLQLDGAGELDGTSEIGRDFMVAQRVARALKLMAFGVESLLA